ncbi:Transcriptional regulator STERILE APETALA [Capsicum annuum]|uniref:transcriptional regulator STERILE APETALA-like n=1 Tax=Capsicum annuum TaxID=4072 RepID=UPI001FB1268E|nr:transcriptional regulator STERILE APETALA-like [Capsicum annuum]KAF3617397.1 Transcriptional regulator STERILE APETALA [Capsicum annuum]KAF3672639.1 Transcriptional regulator STERILE APETALA [Capsicum annuum]
MSSSSSASEEVGGGDSGGSSSRRRRRRGGRSNGVWPEPFLEALARQMAIDASRSIGRLAAAQALSNLFQVCSTWRAVSRSDLLWQSLTTRIWNRHHLLRHTWHDEYIYWHQTSNNLRHSRYIYHTLHFVPEINNDNNNDGLSCRRLALSDHHLAAGFSDGSVQLFHLPTRVHLSTFRPQQRDRLGRYSRAVSGIILTDENLVFASLDGDIHVVVIGGAAPPRRAHLGDVVNDGALVDFTGCDRWWIGLYAGVPGRAFHIWNSETEELIFVDGDLTDPEAVTGWHLLTELTELVGRVRITARDTAVACTGPRLVVIDLHNQGLILRERFFQQELIVGSFDATNELLVAVDGRGVATVCRTEDLDESCRFNVRGASQRGVIGSMNNSGYGVMCVGGLIRVWEVENGVYLYSLREKIGEVNAMHADERHIVACSSDGTIRLWDFGAQ